MFKKLLFTGLFVTVASSSFASPLVDWAEMLLDDLSKIRANISVEDMNSSDSILRFYKIAEGSTKAALARDSEIIMTEIRKLSDKDLKYADSLLKKGRGSFSTLLALAYMVKARDGEAIQENMKKNESYLNTGCKKYKIELSCWLLKGSR